MKRKVSFICDYTVGVHFPSHFSKVYLHLLRDKGWNTEVFALKRHGTDKGDNISTTEGVFLYPEYTGKRMSSIINSLLLVFFYLWYEIFDKQFKTDLYVAHNNPILALFVYVFSRCRNCKFIYRITALKSDDIIEKKNSFYVFIGYFMRALRSWLLRRAHAVIPTSSHMAYVLSSQSGRPFKEFSPLTATVDCETTTSEKDECDQLSSCLASRQSSIACDEWLVYLGSLNPGRRLTFLVDVLKEVRAKGYSVGLVVLGVARHSAFQRVLAEYAQREYVDKYIIWHKKVPEECIPKILESCSVGLSPRPPEPLIMKASSPLKILEYMRSGIPTVATPIPDNVYVFEESEAGIISDWSTESFAESVVNLLEESQNKKTDRKRAFTRWVGDNRDLDNAATFLDKTFRLVINDRVE